MYTHKDSAMFIPSLESRIASNAKSPSFARLAFFYLKEGQPQKAMDICLEGLKHHPNYPTAHLVLGKCYEALKRNIEAMLEYRMVLKSMPDSPAVQNLLKKVEQGEQSSFRAFSEERARKLKDRKEPVTFESYVEERESSTEFLLRRLHDVKKNVPPVLPENRTAEEPQGHSITPSKIVTATLAEIYATQGEFKEAIDAYKKLVSQRPAEAERYAKRISQLEELSKLQQAEHHE